MDPLELFVVELILSVALSYIAGRLLAKKAKGPINDETPVTLATRGSYTNWLIGLRRLGPLFCAVGPRFAHKERAPGSVGGFYGAITGSNTKINVYYQTGMHVICVGPVDELRNIYQDGKLLYQGPLLRSQHPSGTTIDLGKEGSFQIWWGDEESITGTAASPDAAIDAVTAVNSRWPTFCRINWFKKHLGTGTTWPTIEYEVFKKCLYSDALLPSVPSAIAATYGSLTGAAFNNTVVHAGVEGVGYIEVDGGIANRVTSTGTTYPYPLFNEGDKIKLIGNTGLGMDEDFEVLYVTLHNLPYRSLYEASQNGNPYNYTDDTFFDKVQGFLRPQIFVKGAGLNVGGLTDDGTTQRYIKDQNDGLNAAHVAAELLFAPWPVGLGQPTEPYNVSGAGNSLDALAVICDTEGLKASVVSTDGQSGKDLLNNLLLDIGAYMVLNTTTGLIDFIPIRYGTTPITIDASKMGDTFPEIETPVGELPTKRVVYAFSDRGIGFRDRTVSVSADGQAAYEDNQSAQRVQLESIIDFSVAARVADRRSQEALATGSALKFAGSHDMRTLMPGQVVTIPGVPTPVLLTSVLPQSETGKVEFEGIADFLSVQQTGFSGSEGSPGAGIYDPQPPNQFDLVELDSSTIMAPFIRDNATISSTSFYISADNITYYDIAQYGIAAFGGVTTTAMLVGDTTGPRFTGAGPDAGNLLDLSGDSTSYAAGKQWLVIVSTAGTEICYVDQVDITLTSTPKWQIHNIIRAQLGTTAYAHPIGARVYILAKDDAPELSDILIVSGATIYVKPVADGSPLNLTTPKSITLV